MAENTAIEWCDHTFNGWTGCTKVSPACDHCYAESWAKRSGHVQWGPHAERRRTGKDVWKQPEKWQKQAAAFYAAHGRRQRVFCHSLSDWADNQVPIEWLRDLCSVVELAPDVDFLFLTKRIGNVFDRMSDARSHDWFAGRDNAWLGITVCNQAEADRDIPKLLAVPARVRFLSIEPMLGPISLKLMQRAPLWYGDGPDAIERSETGRSLHWVICGGESGPKARPMHPDWARSLRDQCLSAGVAFLFKQWGEWAEHDGHKPTRVIRMDTDVGETLAARCDGFISLAGEFVRDMDDATTDEPYRGLVRIGKAAAGRVLDGMTHDGFPA